MVTTAISFAAPGMLGGMSHAHLVQEMCLDQNFHFTGPKDSMPPTSLVRVCIRQVHPNEFWGGLCSKLMLAADYGTAADYGDLLQLLGYIKAGVKSLVPASGVGECLQSCVLSSGMLRAGWVNACSPACIVVTACLA